MTTWLTQTEAAAHLRMATGTFRNYVSQGFFPFYRHPDTGTKRFKAADLDQAMVLQPAKPTADSQEQAKKLPGAPEK